MTPDDELCDLSDPGVAGLVLAELVLERQEHHVGPEPLRLVFLRLGEVVQLLDDRGERMAASVGTIREKTAIDRVEPVLGDQVLHLAFAVADVVGREARLLDDEGPEPLAHFFGLVLGKRTRTMARTATPEGLATAFMAAPAAISTTPNAQKEVYHRLRHRREDRLDRRKRPTASRDDSNSPPQSRGKGVRPARRAGDTSLA